MNTEEYISIQEASKALSLSENAIRERLNNGKLKGARVGVKLKWVVLLASILEYKSLYGVGAVTGSKRGHIGRGKLLARTYPLSMNQMRNLWQIHQSLALASETVKDQLVIASTAKLQELLFSIPMSDACNPLKDLPDNQVKDWDALK